MSADLLLCRDDVRVYHAAHAEMAARRLDGLVQRPLSGGAW